MGDFFWEGLGGGAGVEFQKSFYEIKPLKNESAQKILKVRFRLQLYERKPFKNESEPTKFYR